MIRKIKIKNQREQGITISSTIPPIPETLGSNINKVTTTPDLNTDGNNFGVRFNVTNQKVIDGYWIVLQEWSQCSLKCGGGVSTLQRMCVPPKHGGNQCEGPAILTKPCNIQPCPFVKELKRKQSNTTIESPPKKPIVKIMPFTDRPQRYTKCIVKESDMLYTKIFDEKVQYVENIQIPVRVVMNNRTLSIFASTDYKSNLMSFDLQRTTLAPSKPHKNCFILTEGEGTEKLKQAEMCPFGFDRVEEVFQEWAYDFNLFKFQCKTAKETIDLDNADAKALDDKFKKKVEQANLDIVEEKSKLINEKLKKKESKDINVQMQKTNQMALQAIQKELTLEEMIKREEEEREQVAEREILQEIDSEKHKHDCLVKAIKEKELEDQYNIKNQQDEKQLQKIRDSAAKEVIIKRSELKSAVLKMRKKALRKKAQLAQQLQAVRYQMANDMNNLYKDGKTENCVNALKDDQGRSAYCEVSFPDDYVKLTNCKNEEDFCVLCCENEFGDMHMDKRQNCIDTLCAPKPPSEETGRWVWTGGNKDLVSDNPFAPNAEKSATPYSSTPAQKLGLK